MADVIVTTVPFGEIDPEPLRLLEAAGVDYVINPKGRKLRPDEVLDMITGHQVLIAGTEMLDGATIAASGLKAICRVGIGLDSVDLTAARNQGVGVAYTPDGPSPAVAELTLGLMLDGLRAIAQSDRRMRAGIWNRFAGRRLSDCTVGLVGTGRIGGRVARHLLGGFPGVRILANDLSPDDDLAALDGLSYVDKETLWRDSDIVSLHVPMTPETVNLVDAAVLARMKPDALLVNTARGGVVNEADLASALTNGTIARAAMDVFMEEPYQGPLTALDGVTLTCHMGSMTVDCRARMEIEATQDAIRFLKGEAFAAPVPESDYDLARRRAEQRKGEGA